MVPRAFCKNDIWLCGSFVYFNWPDALLGVNSTLDNADPFLALVITPGFSLPASGRQ